MSIDFDPQPQPSGCSRRGFLSGGVLGLAGGAAAGWYAHQHLWPRFQNQPVAQSPLLLPKANGIPGKYPGSVIEVNHPGSVHETKRDRVAIKAMLDRGMKELVGCDHPVEAWRSFFSAGDRVGIKVVPVGKPDSISSYEVIHEIVAGLRSAGVRVTDVLVFERYKDDFMSAGYHRNLPDGVQWECESYIYNETQVELDGQPEKAPRESRVSGYDRDVYRELAFCSPQHDLKDDRRFRSHLSKIVTQKVDKFISVPVLKDHRSSGVTLCLKNLSHGLVNNVARSHSSRELNQCGTFIPAMVSLPPIREKAVLQILDGLVGTWEGGPGNWNKTFATWEYKSLFVATDPVALDRVGWEIIDAKRGQEGWPGVARMGVAGEHRWYETARGRVPSEQFDMRQPQHIPLAATLGLGEFDRAKIDHRRIDLT